MKPIQRSFPLNPNLYMPVSHSIDKMTSEKKIIQIKFEENETRRKSYCWHIAANEWMSTEFIFPQAKNIKRFKNHYKNVFSSSLLCPSSTVEGK